MSSDVSEVLAVLSALAIKVGACKEDLSAQAIGNAFYGLQGMSSDVSEVRAVLSALAIKVGACKEDLSAQNIGNAFYGLQGMSSDVSEVRAVLSALAIKVGACKEDLSAQEVGNAFYGLQGIRWIGNSPDFISVVAFLRLKVRIIVNGISKSIKLPPERFSASSIVTRELITLCQSLVFFLLEISTIISMEQYKDLEMMNTLLTDELIRRKQDGDVYYKLSGFQSKAEKRIFNIVTKACRDTDIEINANVHLFDLFESDVILRIPSNDGRAEIIINIEVDGIHHKREKKKTFCERKDKYLKLKGVCISRIDTSIMDDMNDIELEEWVSQLISHARTSANLDLAKRT
jgi:outer membrane murein-binding lipoprotein Lpp